MSHSKARQQEAVVGARGLSGARSRQRMMLLFETERQNLKRLMSAETITNKNSRLAIRTISCLGIEYMLDPVQTESSVGVFSFGDTEMPPRRRMHGSRTLVCSSRPNDECVKIPTIGRVALESNLLSFAGRACCEEAPRRREGPGVRTERPVDYCRVSPYETCLFCLKIGAAGRSGTFSSEREVASPPA